MPDIHCEIEVHAPQERVFKALTHEDGLAGWWTDDALVARKEVRLGFEGGSVTFRMKVLKSHPPELLEWECIGDQPEWTGTKLSWVLRPTRHGHTKVSLAHMGWRDASGYMKECEQVWPQVLERLKGYAESGKPHPFFSG